MLNGLWNLMPIMQITWCVKFCKGKKMLKDEKQSTSPKYDKGPSNLNERQDKWNNRTYILVSCLIYARPWIRSKVVYGRKSSSSNQSLNSWEWCNVQNVSEGKRFYCIQIWELLNTKNLNNLAGQGGWGGGCGGSLLINTSRFSKI